MRQALHLKHPLDGAMSYELNVEGCVRIEPLAGGGYEVHIGTRLVRVPESRVDYFVQDPRPGYAHEQRNREREELPSYAVPADDGAFTCKECGAGAKTLHALKIHYGRSHSARR